MRRTAIVVVSMLVGSCSAIGATSSTTPTPQTTASTTTTTIAATTTSTALPSTTTSATLQGWTVLEAPGEPVTAAARIDETIIVGSCSRSGEGGLFVASADGWEPVASGCVTQIETTPIGILGIGPGVSVGPDRSGPSQRSVLISSNGETWVAHALYESLGLEYPDQLGIPDAVFAAPGGSSVTVLFTRAAEADSRIATLLATTDGVTWRAAEGAEVFDNTDIARVIPGGDGLIAVGASPGGEFVPTAAVFTSSDGASWRRVTPTTSDFDDKIMTDVIATPDGFVAVGGDFFRTGLMTAWTSLDGLSWARSPHPAETLDPDVAHMTAHRVTSVDGALWAAGEDNDASRPIKSLPALWKSDDGGWTWQRVTDEAFVPFVLFDDGRVRIATTVAGDVLLIQR